MPALPAVANVARVDMVFAIGADLTALTRFFIHFSGVSPSAGQLDTFCAAVGTAWGVDLKAGTDNDTTLETVEAVDLTSATSASGLAAIGVAGTRGAAFLPADASFVTSYEIVRRYRGGHPRGYWRLGVVADTTTPQLWTAGVTTGFANSVSTFFTAVNAAGWALAGTLGQVSVSYYEGFHVVTNPITGRARNIPLVRAVPLVDPITAYVGRQRIGSQRRRLGKS